VTPFIWVLLVLSMILSASRMQEMIAVLLGDNPVPDDFQLRVVLAVVVQYTWLLDVSGPWLVKWIIQFSDGIDLTEGSPRRMMYVHACVMTPWFILQCGSVIYFLLALILPVPLLNWKYYTPVVASSFWAVLFLFFIDCGSIAIADINFFQQQLCPADSSPLPVGAIVHFAPLPSTAEEEEEDEEGPMRIRSKFAVSEEQEEEDRIHLTIDKTGGGESTV
jgi:hypothetical protein